MCVCAGISHTLTHTVSHTHTPNEFPFTQSGCNDCGDGETVSLQSVRVYVWRSDTIALWQWWWVLLVSAQCIWQQGDVTVNGSVMTTGWLFYSWLPVHRCLTADTSLNNLWGQSGFWTTKWKSHLVCASETNYIVSPTTNSRWKDNLESHLSGWGYLKGIHPWLLFIFNTSGWIKK